MESISDGSVGGDGESNSGSVKASDLSPDVIMVNVTEIPTDYIQGHEKARAVNPQVADNYVAHTMVGDPDADALIAELAPLGPQLSSQLINAAMTMKDMSVLIDAPPILMEFFEKAARPPEWVDLDEFVPGIRMFHRNSRLILGAFVGGVLVEGFSTNIGRSFNITGRLRENGVRRLKQNNRHMIEIFMPHGLAIDGDGWRLSVRVRLVHAQVRYLLSNSDDWDTEAWGIPLSSAHMGYSITAFSARLLQHMKSLGAIFNDAEGESFLAVWRYTGHLMGIPETILFQNEKDALELYRIGRMCEPPPDWDSIIMANGLVNSAPLVVGITEPAARRNLARYVYRVSRAMIGNQLADALRYPPSPTFGVLPFFRLQTRYYRLIEKHFPKYSQVNNFTNFTGLLEASAFDEAGISYRMPDHAHAERSVKW